MTVIPEFGDGEQRVFFKAGGEWCYLCTLGSFRRSEPAPVVIHHHGARGYVREGEADWLDTESKTAYLRAVMEGGGCAIAGSHACGDHWGNPDSVAANAALFEALDESPHIDVGRTGLMGGGLGGALIWNSVLGPLAGKTRAVVVMQAVANLSAVIWEQKFKAPCIAAYGLPEDTPDDEAISKVLPHDPMPRLQRLKPGTPLPRVAIYHGSRDENIPAATSAVPLAEALRKAGAEVELELFTDVEHDVYGMGKPIEERLRAFFAENL
ncbi:MAG: prolyl oligopeptidase family serine peptidase [Candidatus Bathyarchaeota archaeon]|nr:MAG: prolyl oligopeptidase family serine peptidase [Candidatus Bathyarchaeota archaeon]